MADRIQAAIRRATFEAHKDVARLDARGIEELEAMYQSAAEDLRMRIAAHAGADGSIAIQELRSVLDQVEGRLRELSGARDALLTRGIQDAAALGLSPYSAAAVIAPAAAMAVSHTAVQFVRNFVAEDGLQLSDRLWRIDRGARDAVVNAIERAVIQGHGANQAALEFLARGEAVPRDLAAKTRMAAAGAIEREAGAALVKDPASAMAHARRLFRTEINRAHGEAYMAAGEKVEGFAGWQYLLSPAHPQPDICDLLSTQNLYGLGAGVYPTREKTPWPAHPNTLSFVVIRFLSNITDADRAGKETPMQALARLPEDVRQGVLGVGKTEIFDQGKLTQGMIRTPLAKVRVRVQGRNTQLSEPDMRIVRLAFNPKQARVPAGTVDGGRWVDGATIARWAEEARVDPGRNLTHEMGSLSLGNLAAVEAGAKLRLDGFRRIAEDRYLRHVWRSHGGAEHEAARGQRAVTMADFALLPAITRGGTVSLSAKVHRGDAVIEYRKIVGAEEYIYAETVRRRGYRVALLSMRIRKLK